MEKAQVTTELIGLRGGLSLLSKYTDDIKAQEKEVEDAVFELESLKKAISTSLSNTTCKKTDMAKLKLKKCLRNGLTMKKFFL